MILSFQVKRVNDIKRVYTVCGIVEPKYRYEYKIAIFYTQVIAKYRIYNAFISFAVVVSMTTMEGFPAHPIAACCYRQKMYY